MKTEELLIDTKELSIVRGQVTKAVSAAQSLAIKNDSDLGEANDLRAKIKKVGLMITARKEGFTKPAYQAYKMIMEEAKSLFGPLEEQYQFAEKVVKGKMIEYHNLVEAKAKAEEAKLAARVEKGTMKFETAIKKVEEIQKPETTIESGKSKATFRIEKKFEVTDMSKLPIEYHLPDLTKIRQDMYKGIQVGGVKYWEEKNLSGN